MIKRTILILLSVLVLVVSAGCGVGNKKNNNPDNDNDNDNDKSNELYAFIKTYLDYKEVAVEEIESKQDSFDERVKALASDFAIDLPIAPLKQLSTLEKEGDSWEGTLSVWEYEITKDGDVYTFKFDHTMIEEITEGTCNPKEGTLSVTVTGEYNITKYQVKRISKGEYLRFWSEKAFVLTETRSHHTYFKGKNIAMGQDEVLEPTELTDSQYNDMSYVELLEDWVKLNNGKTSDSVKGEN